MALTLGGLQSILNEEKIDKPIFQITNMKRMGKENESPKYRLMLTDGQTSNSLVMLGTGLNERVESGEIKQDSKIQLENYLIKVQADKKILVIIGLTVITAQNSENISPVLTIMNPSVTKQIKPAVLAASNIQTIDISLLNPYQNKWSIKGRVLKKESIRTWSNPKGEGKLFNFTMFDDSCDVKVTAFNQDVDRFFNLVEVDKTYILSKGLVKVADRRFNTTKCDHEITLKTESEITEVQDDLHIPVMVYNFVEIGHLKECSVGSAVDIVGMVHEIKDTTTIITKKANKEIMKKEVVLVDRSGCSVNLTLWGDDIKLVENVQHPVIVVRGAKISDFSGRSLSVGFDSIIKINPDNIPEAKLLLGWYQAEGFNGTFSTQSVTGGGSFMSKKATISELACTSSDKSDFYAVEAVVGNIKTENLVYKACGKCNKKLIDHNNGLYGCLKCDVEGPDFKYRMMVQINIFDHTGSNWMTAFQECAEKILGVSADTIGQMLENEQKDEVDKIISAVLYKDQYLCKVKVFNDTYNDETRMKAVLNDITIIDNKDVLVSLLSELSVS